MKQIEETAPTRAMKQLLALHTEWLHKTDSTDLYQRPDHAERMKIVLGYTAHLKGNILDLGCYDGYFSEQILQQGGKTVYGMDRLPATLKLAEERGVQPVLGDIDSGHIAFPDNFFDVVVMGSVLQYVFDPDLAMVEVKRVLKSRGTAIITTPNLAALDNRIRLLFGRAPLSLDVRPSQGGYWRYFTFDTLQELVYDHGFAIARMESNVCIVPIFLIPGIDRFFTDYQWEKSKLFSNKALARLLPRLGEQIILLAHNQ